MAPSSVQSTEGCHKISGGWGWGGGQANPRYGRGTLLFPLLARGGGGPLSRWQIGGRKDRARTQAFQRSPRCPWEPSWPWQPVRGPSPGLGGFSRRLCSRSFPSYCGHALAGGAVTSRFHKRPFLPPPLQFCLLECPLLRRSCCKACKPRAGLTRPAEGWRSLEHPVGPEQTYPPRGPVGTAAHPPQTGQQP